MLTEQLCELSVWMDLRLTTLSWEVPGNLSVMPGEGRVRGGDTMPWSLPNYHFLQGKLTSVNLVVILGGTQGSTKRLARLNMAENEDNGKRN